jgi:hypothetical protein
MEEERKPGNLVGIGVEVALGAKAGRGVGDNECTGIFVLV